MENFVSAKRTNYVMYTDNTVNDSLLFLGRSNSTAPKAPNKRELKRRLEESYAQTKKDIDTTYNSAVTAAEKLKPADFATATTQDIDAYFAALKAAFEGKSFKTRTANDDYEISKLRIDGATEDEVKVVQERQRVLNAKEDEFNNTVTLIYSDAAKVVRQTNPKATPSEIRNSTGYKESLATAEQKYRYTKNDLTASFETQLKKLRRAQNLGKTAEILQIGSFLSGLSKQANVPPAQVQLQGDNTVISTADLETVVDVNQSSTPPADSSGSTPPDSSGSGSTPPDSSGAGAGSGDKPPAEAGFFSGKTGKIVGVLFIVATLGYLAFKMKDGNNAPK
jgi:hypothetical protein